MHRAQLSTPLFTELFDFIELFGIYEMACECLGNAPLPVLVNAALTGQHVHVVYTGLGAVSLW